MAIPFLNNINLSDNELQNAKLQITGTAPTSATGQIYYDSSLNVARYYDNNGWLRITDSSVASGTFVSSTLSGTNSEPIFTVELSATGTPSSSTFLRGDNTWASLSTTDTTYDLTGTGSSNGTAGVLLTGSDSTTDTVLIVGAGTSTVTRSGNTLTVTSNDQYDGTVTSVGLSMPSAFSVSNSPVTSSGTLTVAGAGTTSQYVDGTGALQTFPNIPQGDLTGLTEGDYISISNASGPVPTINALGTTASTPSRLIARDASGFGYVDTPSSGDSSEKIATTAFVQSALTRLLEFKGGFNANTGDLDSPLSGDLYVNVAISVGDFYVVTTAGNFFGNTATPLTPGDSVIVQTAKTAGNAAEADFIVVQSDTDLATNSTPGLMFINPSGTGISSNISSGQATLTNTDKGSSQNIFKNVASDSGTAVADNNNDTLTIAGGTNVTTSVTGDTLTITSIDTNTQRGAGVGLSLNGNNIDANVDGTQTVAANSSSTATGRTYNVQVDSSNDLVVNVPWVNTTSGGTVTSVSASHEGNAFTVSVGSSTTTPAIDIDVVGSSSQYINGEGNLVTFPDYTAEGTISAGSTTGSVNHNWGTEKVIVQTYLDSSTLNYPTVYCDITRASNSVTATIATAETDDIVILVQKIG